MIKWHERAMAKVGLRIAGLALLALAWLFEKDLAALVRAAAPDATTPTEFLLAMLLFLGASAGAALVIYGPGLWRKVQVAERWTTRTDDRDVGKKAS